MDLKKSFQNEKAYQSWMEHLKATDLFVKELIYSFIRSRPVNVVVFSAIVKRFFGTISSIVMPTDKSKSDYKWTIADFLRVWNLEDVMFEVSDEMAELGLDFVDVDEVLISTIKSYFFQKLILEHPEIYKSKKFERYKLPSTILDWLSEAGFATSENEPLFWTATLEPVELDDGYDFFEFTERLKQVSKNLEKLDALLVSLEDAMEKLEETEFEVLPQNFVQEAVRESSFICNLMDSVCNMDKDESIYKYVFVSAPVRERKPIDFDKLRKDLEKVKEAFLSCNFPTPKLKLNVTLDDLFLAISFEATNNQTRSKERKNQKIFVTEQETSKKLH